MSMSIHEKIVATLIALALGLVVLLLVDLIRATPESHACVIVSRVYTPASTSFGTAMGTNSKGRSSTHFVTTTTPESYTVIVTTDDGTFSVKTSSDVWAKAKDGDKASACYWRGRLTGIWYSTTIVN